MGGAVLEVSGVTCGLAAAAFRKRTPCSAIILPCHAGLPVRKLHEGRRLFRPRLKLSFGSPIFWPTKGIVQDYTSGPTRIRRRALPRSLRRLGCGRASLFGHGRRTKSQRAWEL